MLYYDRIDVSEGIDVNKTSASKECDVCHYWYFLNYIFKGTTKSCRKIIFVSPAKIGENATVLNCYFSN